jgi:hypothetical protein
VTVIERAPAIPDHGKPPRFTVRRKSYRGEDGWLVYESPHRCDRVMCFQRYSRRWWCATEAEARRMAGEAKRGLAPMFDFQMERAIAKGWADKLREAGYEIPIAEVTDAE